MAMAAVLGCIVGDARANDIDQQADPEQVPLDEEPFQQEYPRFDWGYSFTGST